MAAIWNDTRRRRVESAIITTALPYAYQTWSRVELRLDDYSLQLAAAERASCEDGLTVQSPTQRCLDLRVAALRRTVALLEDADDPVVERAIDLVASLPDVAQCLEAESNAESGPFDVQEQVEALRERLNGARAKVRAGLPRQGLREVEQAALEAEALGDAVLLAEAQLTEGFVRLKNDQLGEARRSLQRAFEAAMGRGFDRVALEAATSLAFLLGVKQAQTEAGLWMGSVANGLAQRHEPQGPLHAEALVVMAQVLTERGQYAEAQSKYEEALEILSQWSGPDDLPQVAALDGLGQVLRHQGRFEQAQQRFEQALTIRIAALGDRHPQVAHQRINLGNLLYKRDELAAADGQYEEALEILSVLSSHREVKAQLHASLGVLRGRQGRHDEGERELRLAVDAWEALYGVSHPIVAKGRLSLGARLRHRGALQEAAEQYERARRAFEAGESTRVNTDLLVRTLRSLGRVRNEQGQPDRALALFARALQLLEREGRARTRGAISLHDLRGRVHRSLGDAEQAVAEHRVALEILEAMAVPEPGRLVETLLDLARAERAAGQPRMARDHLERALTLIRAYPDDPALSPDYRAECTRLRAELTEALERGLEAETR